jgi:hypothetical protein
MCDESKSLTLSGRTADELIEAKEKSLMKLVRMFCLVTWVPLLLASGALSQSPTITSIEVRETNCTYTVGKTTTPCKIGPGMTLAIEGSNFGDAPGGVDLCDCNVATTLTWTSTQVVSTVNWATLNSVIRLETPGGAFSNTVPYIALGPVITSINVGSCSYVPDVSVNQCIITSGSHVTIYGSFFGPGPGEVATCDCQDATIGSWDEYWATNPSPGDNNIVVTVVNSESGSTIRVRRDGIWSNAIPYTSYSCGQ